MILAVETSCDDTCAAVVDRGRILSNVISSQAATSRGVRRRRARDRLAASSRARQPDRRRRALREAGVSLDDLDAVAVTRGPGLIGALLVGVSTAKALAAARRLPMVEVDHLHGHVAANFLEPEPLEPPFLCLIASGGHTLLAGVTGQATGSRPLARRSTMPPARRSTRRPGCSGSGYPGRPGDRAGREQTAIRSAFASRSRWRAIRGSTSASRASRRRSSMPRGISARSAWKSSAPISRPAFRRRSSAS